VGVIIPLSGALAHMGESVRNGFTLWKERNPSSNIEFLFEDDQFQPRHSASAAQKLISVDKVAALVTFTSGPGKAVAPIAEKNRVVHFCFTVDSRLAEGRYNFVHLFQSRDAAARLLKKIKAEGIKRIGIMRFIEDAAQLSATEVMKQAPDYGVEVLFDQAFPGGTTDFRSLITSASTKKAEMVVIIALPPELELLAKQMKELHFAARITSIEIFSLSTQPRLFEGLWYAQPAFPDQEYAAAYKKRFGSDFAWGHYADNIASLLKAASESEHGARLLVEGLESLSGIKSTVGPLSADPEGVFTVPVVIAVMKGGRPVQLEQ